MSLGVFTSAAFTSASGVAIAASATVEVRREDTNGLASIFQDSAGGTPESNPFTADSAGRFTFYAAGLADGYKVTVTKGSETFALRNVAIGTAGYLDAGSVGALVIAAATEAAAQQAIGAEIGVDAQAYSPDLEAIASLFAGSPTPVATFAYLNASGVWVTAAIGADVQAYSPELTALAAQAEGSPTPANMVPIMIAPGDWGLTSYGAFGLTLLATASQAAARSALALVPGTDVQAYSDSLAALVNLIAGSPSVDGKRLRVSNGAYELVDDLEALIIAASDETTALSAGVDKVVFRMPYAFTVTEVRASLSTAQASGSTFTVDIHESGVSILSTRITIDNTEETSTTAAAPAVISDPALADDAEISIDIDTIGDGTAKGLKVMLIGRKA